MCVFTDLRCFPTLWTRTFPDIIKQVPAHWCVCVKAVKRLPFHLPNFLHTHTAMQSGTELVNVYVHILTLLFNASWRGGVCEGSPGKALWNLKFRAATGQIIAPGAAINTPKSFELSGSACGHKLSYVFNSCCVSAIFSAYLCDRVGHVALIPIRPLTCCKYTNLMIYFNIPDYSQCGRGCVSCRIKYQRSIIHSNAARHDIFLLPCCFAASH